MKCGILKITVEQDVVDALRVLAIAERRPLNWQAEVMLRRSLGLPCPCPADESAMCDKAVAR